MQEQSQLPAFDNYYSQGATNLCSLTTQNNPCARKLFYMTWGRKFGDSQNCVVWPPVCTYEGMDSLLRLAYIDMAQRYNGEVSPVGAVWRYLRLNFPSIELYQSDNSHPSAAGSYAAACSFYAMLFKKNPALSTYNFTLSGSDAAIIRNAAKVIVFDSLQHWDFSDHSPIADFSYSIGNGMNEIITTNYSQNFDFINWDFGDGFSSALTDPVHSYISDGTYAITLTALNCDLSDTNQSVIQRTVNFCQHSPTIDPDSMIDCPNTDDTLWTQVYDSYQWYDQNGIAIPNANNQFLIPFGNWKYTVVASKNNCAELSPPAYVEVVSSGMTIYFVDSSSTSTRTDTLCMGDTVLLIINSNKPGGNDFYFQWYNNGSLLSSATDDSLVVTTDGNYTVKVFNSQYCAGYAFFESNPLTLDFINCNINVHESDLESILKVFPNPANDKIILNAGNSIIGSKYSITDITGKVVKKGIIENETINITVGDLVNGLYFLELITLNKSMNKILQIIHR